MNQQPSLAETTSGALLGTIAGAVQTIKEALGALLLHHHNYLRTIVSEHLDSALRPRVGDSVDLVQETFLNALNHLRAKTDEVLDVLGSEASLKAWLRTIAKNHLHNEHRDQSAGCRDYRRDVPVPEEPARQPPSPGPGPSSAARNAEREELLRQAVNTLDEADRMLYRLMYEHGWKYGQLAALLEGKEPADLKGKLIKRMQEARVRVGAAPGLQDYREGDSK